MVNFNSVFGLFKPVYYTKTIQSLASLLSLPEPPLKILSFFRENKQFTLYSFYK